MSSGVYTITSIIDNKMYVGYTTNFSNRCSSHFRKLSKNQHPNDHLQLAYNKYGKSNFLFQVLVECDHEHLCSEEHYWATLLNTHNPVFGYNIKPTHPKEKNFRIAESTKIKLSIINTGKKASEATMAIYRQRKPSIETKEKMSSSHKGVAKSKDSSIKSGLTRRGMKFRKDSCDKMSKAKSIPIIQLSLSEEIVINEWQSAKHAAIALGLCKSKLRKVCRKDTITDEYNGFRWIYKSEYEQTISLIKAA